jgi:hypothetical protein
MKTFTCVALVLALVLAACGGEDGSADGAAVLIDEALAGDSDEPLLVTGNLLAQGGDIRLCSALAESFPPQCGGASLVVDGLELEGANG